MIDENQTNIFDFLYKPFKIDKKIRIIELFGGYGSQLLSLKYIGAEVEQWKLCEWAIKSIQAYKDVHYPNDNTDYSKDLTKENIIDILHYLGISNNYNEPMSLSQIKRLKEEDLRTIYNNIVATKNLVNIQKVKGEDLEIVDTDKYCYIMTYSFPCQDLSLAGKRALMSDTSTRSGLLWEVERVLSECKNKPQVLLMENVPQVHGEGALEDFIKWQNRLEELGYKNYWKDLIATDYGIPQTRNRTFMVSILGDYNYTFPKPIPLKKKLKDLLEDEVDQKYFLSDKQIKDIQSWNAYEKPLENMEKTDENNISPTLTTRSGAYAAGMILIKNNTKKGYLEATEGDGINLSSRMEYQRGNVQKDMIQTIDTMGGHDRGVVVNPLKGKSGKSWQFEQQVYDENGCARTLKSSEGSGNIPKVVTYMGTYQYSKSDKFMKGKDRLQIDKDTSDTLSTTQHEGVVVLGNYSASNHNASRIVDTEHSAPTVMENHGTITAIVDKPKVLGGIGEKKSNNGTQWYQHDRIYDDKVAITVTTECNLYYKTDLRIRKLTPRECLRLMGVHEDDITNMMKHQSDNSLYHLAGDSIVTNCLQAIFGEML